MDEYRFDKTLKSNGKRVNKKRKPGNTLLSDICKAIQEIKYGSVQIHIQDGKVVQFDKINKIRTR